MQEHDRDFDDLLETARTLLGGNEDRDEIWEADRIVTRALRMRPHDPEAWLLKCQVLSAQDDDFSALAAAEMALGKSPKSPEVHYWRGAVLADLGRFPEALRSIETSFRCLAGGFDWLLEDLYFEKAMILDSIGRKEDAMETLNAGLARCPESPVLRAGLAPLERERLRSSLRIIKGGAA